MRSIVVVAGTTLAVALASVMYRSFSCAYDSALGSPALSGTCICERGRAMSNEGTIQMLQRVLDAFYAHDVDAIMAHFAEDCDLWTFGLTASSS